MPEMDCAGCVVDVAIAVVDRYLNGIARGCIETEISNVSSPGIGRHEPLTHNSAVLSGCSTCEGGVEMHLFT